MMGLRLLQEGMMGENRGLKRRHLIYYLKVMQRDTDELLGYLVDITRRGIMVMSEHPVPTGKTFPLRVLIPAAGRKLDALDLDARSIWCERSANPSFFDAGLELLDVNSAQYETIDSLIGDLGFSD